MTIETLTSVVIFAGSLIYLLWPLLGSEKAPPQEKERISRQNLSVQKETLLALIKDLELDHQLKKVSDEDFKELYDDALLEGAGLMKKMERK